MFDRKILFRDLFRGDSVVWTVFMLLCLISIIEVYSASSSLSYESGDYQAAIKAHCLMLGLGGVLVVVVHRIGYRWFRLVSLPLLPLSAVMLLALFVMGQMADARTNGAARWLFGFQPSELAKMALVLETAHLLARHQRPEGCSPAAFRPLLVGSGVIIGLIAPENGSTALLLAAVVFFLMVIGRVPWRQLGRLVGVVTVSGTLAVSFILLVPPSVYEDVPGTHRFSTWRNRMTGFFSREVVPPEKFDIDRDAQVAHAHIAVATSHVLGLGPGNSVQRDFLSHGYSDFIYAIVIEELGLVGAAGVVLLYIILLFRAGYIARRCSSPRAALLVMGSALMLVTQAMLHMMVSVELFPVTGQPLPLISKGGTSILINCFYMAVILSVSRTVDEERAAQVGVQQLPVEQQAAEGR